MRHALGRLASPCCAQVIIPLKAVGDAVNLEVDVISKYVEQSLAAVLARVNALEKRLEAAGLDK